MVGGCPSLGSVRRRPRGVWLGLLLLGVATLCRSRVGWLSPGVGSTRFGMVRTLMGGW